MVFCAAMILSRWSLQSAAVSPWFSGCSARACSARCSTAFASACLSCTLALSSLCDRPRRGTQCSLASRTRGARTGRAGNRPQQPEVALGVDGCAWSSNPASVRVAAADRTSPHPHRPHVPKAGPPFPLGDRKCCATPPPRPMAGGSMRTSRLQSQTWSQTLGHQQQQHTQ